MAILFVSYILHMYCTFCTQCLCIVRSFEEYYVMFTCSYTFMTLIHYFNDCFMYASLFSYVWKNRTLVMLNDFIFAETEWEKLKVFRLSFEFWRKYNVFVKCNIRIKNKSTNREMRFCIFFYTWILKNFYVFI